MEKIRKHGLKKPCPADPGICFEPLEPRLLLSGTWGAGAEAPSVDSQAASQDGFAKEAVSLPETTDAFYALNPAQGQRMPEKGILVDVLSQVPALDVLSGANHETQNASKPDLPTPSMTT